MRIKSRSFQLDGRASKRWSSSVCSGHLPFPRAAFCQCCQSARTMLLAPHYAVASVRHALKVRIWDSPPVE
jgi:hypothetical protein